MAEHLGEDLFLEKVAGHFYHSATYFSGLSLV